MSSEFVLHVKDSYDYRFLSYDKKDEIIEMILRVICGELKICTAFHIFFVPMINLNSVMTSHSKSKKGEQIRPSKNFLKLMNLEKYLNEEETEVKRKTELRKRTTMLYNKEKKNKKEICIEDFELLKVLG